MPLLSRKIKRYTHHLIGEKMCSQVSTNDTTKIKSILEEYWRFILEVSIP